MATAITNIRGIEWMPSYSGSDTPFIVILPEAASQTFKAGTLVVYDQSLNGVKAVANTSGVPDAQTFTGIARHDASGTTADPVEVQIPRPNDVFAAALASAENTFVAPDDDNRFALFGLIEMDAANGSVYALDEGNTDWARGAGLMVQDLNFRGKSPTENISGMSTGDRLLFYFLTSVTDAVGQVA